MTKLPKSLKSFFLMMLNLCLKWKQTFHFEEMLIFRTMVQTSSHTVVSALWWCHGEGPPGRDRRTNRCSRAYFYVLHRLFQCGLYNNDQFHTLFIYFFPVTIYAKGFALTDSPALILQLVRNDAITTCPPCHWLEMRCHHLLLISMTCRSNRKGWCWCWMGTSLGAQRRVFAWTPCAPCFARPVSCSELSSCSLSCVFVYVAVMQICLERKQ